jgi:uncharacterized membrane protein
MEQSVLLERLAELPIPLQPNPALLEHARERAESVQNRIADRITAFAGSMKFGTSTCFGSALGSSSASRATRTVS